MVVVDVVVGGGEVVVVVDVVGGDEAGVDEEQLAARIATDIAAIKATKVVLLVISRIPRGGGG